jgi:two-component system, OmpR family, sensor histidine kinase CiaH
MVLSYYLARRTLRPIEAAIRVQSQFASDVSHELRTPLTIMQIETEENLRRLKLSQPIKKLLESNLEELTHLHELSEMLLRLARSEHIEVELVWTDEIVTKAINRTMRNAQAKNITIIDATSRVAVIAHPQSLLEILVILLNNAIKYSPPNTHVYMEDRRDKKYGYLQVRDEGPGIASEEISYIFDRFYRGTTASQEGHGLGLALAKALALKQYGSLIAKSVPEKGATFVLKFPLYRGKKSK